MTPEMAEHTSEMDVAANRVGYSLEKAQGQYRLYRLSQFHPNRWGVVTEYKAIGIGNGSDIIARTFPYVKEGGSSVLDDYTFDDLKKYKMVFLNSFEFRDRTYAEDLVVKLSEAGVKVIISADGIPEDRNVQGKVFLGVVSNPISFSQGFPILQTIAGDLDTDLFPEDSREWNTYFCDGLDEVWGTVKDDNYKISFLGKRKNDNIVYIGLNLVYYFGQTRDKGVENLLGKIMDLSTTTLPDRKIVPLDIKFQPDRIVINSKYDNVDTTLAYHNFFNLDKKKYEDNHLLIVPSGVTEIELKYPNLAPGLICTLLSFVLAIIYHVLIYFREISGQRKKKEVE